MQKNMQTKFLVDTLSARWSFLATISIQIVRCCSKMSSSFSNSIIIQLTSFRPTAEPSTIAMNRILAVLRGSL